MGSWKDSLEDVENLKAENQRLRNEVCRLRMALEDVFSATNQALQIDGSGTLLVPELIDGEVCADG